MPSLEAQRQKGLLSRGVPERARICQHSLAHKQNSGPGLDQTHSCRQKAHAPSLRNPPCPVEDSMGTETGRQNSV